ncbi:MAG: SUMF1/EgtB/PvdO family nonheme iron enzyme [Myxococcota bacterium]
MDRSPEETVDKPVDQPLSETAKGNATAPKNAENAPEFDAREALSNSKICQSKSCQVEGYAAIPAGSFLAGSPPWDDERGYNESWHAVTISRPFLLKKTEVTQGEWLELMEENPSIYHDCGDDCPVDSVRWFDAIVYLNKLSERDGLEACYEVDGCDTSFGCDSLRFKGLSCQGYRLPTEAEWEYAARAGGEAMPADLDAVAWYSANSEGLPHPVGQKQPNAWGVYDMHGNLPEMTNDGESAKWGGGPATDPAYTGEGQPVYTRGKGCGYRSSGRGCRATSRYSVHQYKHMEGMGFRAARSLGPEAVVNNPVAGEESWKTCPDTAIARDDGEGCCEGQLRAEAGQCVGSPKCGMDQQWDSKKRECVPLGCEPGQVKNRDTHGHCCWPGQAFNGETCVGEASCPGDLSLSAAKDSCEPADCATGKVAVGGVYCCWPGKNWSDIKDKCVGIPSNCPAEARVLGGECVSKKLLGYAEIPAGTFTMGWPRSGGGDEESRRVVTISRPFLLRRTEVTQGEWQELMGYSPSEASECGAHCPVEEVNWFEVLVYLNKLSEKEGLDACYELGDCSGEPGDDFRCRRLRFEGLSCRGYRLPTEAEWEYAARAGTSGKVYGEIDDIAWHEGNTDRAPKPVGQKEPNALGLYDVVGNVSEWVYDRDGPEDLPAIEVTDPIGPSSGGSRVIRGCDWDGGSCSIATRNSIYTIHGLEDLGFRPARTIVEPSGDQ